MSDWKPCLKLPVVVHVREQRPGEAHVSTREGITPVKPDDLIMRGVSGEEYPIGRAIFDSTYTFDLAAANQGNADRIAELERENDRLIAERDALRRDAERYRYIVDNCEVIGPDGHFIDDDEQLDAAMKEAK